MGVIFKTDLEKLLKEAKQKSLIPDVNDARSSYGERVRDVLVTRMGRDKAYGHHLEAEIRGDSLIFKHLNKLTEKGRAFEELMDKQGSDEYNEQFKTVVHPVREAEFHERNPDNPLYKDYDYEFPEYRQFEDEFEVKTRTDFAMLRGKNDVVIDLVLTGDMYYEEFDEGGFPRRKYSEAGLFGEAQGFFSGQTDPTGIFYEDFMGIKREIRDPVYATDIDSFQHQFQLRLDEVEKRNNARLKELGYDPILKFGDEGFFEQRAAIDNDPRFIEEFPDLTNLPPVKDRDGNTYHPAYDIVIHINGKKVDPQDLELAFQQLTRAGAYELTSLESGRDFLVEQGVRGAAFHASIFPQQMAMGAIKAPSKMAKEGEQALLGNVLQKLMAALSQGISR